ncbi:MAG: hypothetical protein WAV55_10155 [Clostridiaceae bacterium]
MKQTKEELDLNSKDLTESRRNQDLLKDTPETGEEGYTENMEATKCELCGCHNGIKILPAKGGILQ